MPGVWSIQKVQSVYFAWTRCATLHGVPRSLVLSLDAVDPRLPLFARIARALADDIARGRLRPGDRLPGTRALATMLGAHRNTVHRAVAELVAQGWVEARPRAGLFVRGVGDADRPRPFARGIAPRAGIPERTGYELGRTALPPAGEALSDKKIRVMSGGIPDPRLFPTLALARAYRRALRVFGGRVLDYGDAYGYGPLRTALARMLSETRGLAAGEGDVLITRGSQMALHLVAHALFRPGDRVAIEALGYPPAWEAFRSAGASVVPIPVDRDGVDVEAVAEAAAKGGLRAVYVTPHHQYPTMATLSAARRLRLLELARAHRFAVLEDDYDHEYHYRGRPVLPLASIDREGHVIYVGSLSKVLAPGLRIGYVVAPRPLLERLARIRTHVDRQGDGVAEAAVAELLEDGEIARHVRATRRVYAARQAAFVEALRDRFGARLRFAVPPGGMALWVRAESSIDVGRWTERALARGVLFRPGRDLHVDGRARSFARLGFTRLDERELRAAVAALAGAADEATTARKRRSLPRAAPGARTPAR